MIKPLLIWSMLATPAVAQMQHSAEMPPANGMAGMDMNQEADGMGNMIEFLEGAAIMMNAMQRMRDGTGADSSTMRQAAQSPAPLGESGQSAFAAIAEVVRQLEADPNTDWTNVTIDVLREHLRDMDVVTIDSTAVAEDVPGGVRFTITGGPDVAPSITRMALAHASVMDGVDGWKYSAEALENGATLTVLVPEADLAKLKALGFYGMLASGMHHQPHHWMMANGGGMGG